MTFESVQDRFIRYLTEMNEYDPTFLPRFVEGVSLDDEGCLQSADGIEHSIHIRLRFPQSLPSVRP